MDQKRNIIFTKSSEKISVETKVLAEPKFSLKNIPTIKKTQFNFNGSESIQDNNFILFLKSLKKNNRKEKDNSIIMTYLQGLLNFVNILKTWLENWADLIKVISQSIKYEYYEQNKLLFKQGEKGDKFYLIIKGMVYVLVAKEQKMLMTEEEYISYLGKLHLGEEDYLLNNCLNANRKVLFLDSSNFNNKSFKRISKVSYDEKLKEVINYDPKEKHYYKDYMDYIEKTKPVHNPDKNTVCTKLYELKVWQYYLITTLKSGEFFGDTALNSNDQKRTASIMIREDCHFGVLGKATFDVSIKEANEKQNNSNLTILLNNQIFNDFSRKYFKKYYYNLFVSLKYDIYKKVIVEGNQAENIYLIKNGEFEIKFKKSLIELTDFIKSQGGIIKNSQDIEEKIFDSHDFKKYMNEKKNIRISILKDSDIIGLGDMVMYDKNVFSVECISSKGEVFKLEKNIILEKENNLPALILDLSNKKKKNLIERLIKIHESKIAHFFNCYDKAKNKALIPSDIFPMTKKQKNQGILTVKNNFDMKDFNNLVKRLSNKKVEYFTNPREPQHTKLLKLNHRTLTSVPRFDKKNSSVQNTVQQTLRLNTLELTRMKKFQSNVVSNQGIKEISDYSKDILLKMNAQNSKGNSLGSEEFNDDDNINLKIENPFTSFKENAQLISSVSFFDNSHLNFYTIQNQGKVHNDFKNSSSQTMTNKDFSSNITSSSQFIKTVENFKPKNVIPINNKVRKQMNLQGFFSFSNNNQPESIQQKKSGFMDEYRIINTMMKTKKSFRSHLFGKIINEYCQQPKEKIINCTNKKAMSYQEKDANVVDCLSYDNLNRLYSKVILRDDVRNSLGKLPLGKNELIKKKIKFYKNSRNIKTLEQSINMRNYLNSISITSKSKTKTNPDSDIKLI